jgi:hypothetical protein
MLLPEHGVESVVQEQKDPPCTHPGPLEAPSTLSNTFCCRLQAAAEAWLAADAAAATAAAAAAAAAASADPSAGESGEGRMRRKQRREPQPWQDLGTEVGDSCQLCASDSTTVTAAAGAVVNSANRS